MVFSSLVFVFLFLPATLVLYFFPWPLLGISSWKNFDRLIPWRNAVLLVCSLFFYTWGELKYVVVMLLSVFVVWICALGVARSGKPRAWLTLGVAADIGILLYFKYANFLYANLRPIIPLSAETLPLELEHIHLPIGISFFTFQALSYLVDVYRRVVAEQPSFPRLVLYLSYFPQLIAGPIVRYRDVAADIDSRIHSLREISYGTQRFIFGLAQKVLLANQLGLTANELFAVPPENLTTGMCWLAAVCYSLQIYYDFAGYSNMAIGMGRICGFQFLENFNHPYISQSITEFWRRWHISLSTWFRDYLYIPLGGSRHGIFRTSCNLLTVFFLCGLWHGASWNFVVWGLYHGTLLLTERVAAHLKLPRLPRLLRHVRTLVLVIFGWMIFRLESLAQVGSFWKRMLGFGATTQLRIWPEVLTGEAVVLLVIGIALCRPYALLQCYGNVPETFRYDNQPVPVPESGITSAGAIVAVCMLLLSLSYLATGSFNPFIYFRF